MDAHEPDCPKYPTDMDASQWQAIARLIPPGKPVGIARSTPMRAVVNAILYRARSGCSWRMLPRDFPHWRTVYGYYRQWQHDGTWQNIRDTLRRQAKRQAEAVAPPGGVYHAFAGSGPPASCGSIPKHAKNFSKFFGCRRFDV
jgi:putative transposase